MKGLRKIRERDGAVLVLTVVLILVLLMIASLAVDLGVLYIAGRQCQDVADAAAIAGAAVLTVGQAGSPDASGATKAAQSAASANHVLGTTVTLDSGDVTVGSWNSVNQTVGAWDPTVGNPAVQVTVRRTQGSTNGSIPTFFAKLFGVTYTEVSKSAAAGLVIEYNSNRTPVSVMVVQDGSGSFEPSWPASTAAIAQLFGMINGVSVNNDGCGVVVFNAYVPPQYWPTGYTNAMNTGIKFSTNASGNPRPCSASGVSQSTGQERALEQGLTALNPANKTQLPTALANGCSLLENDNAWGDTDTAVGLNYAITQLENAPSGNQKIIILISDGEPHSVQGASYTAQFQQDAINASNQAAADGIIIHTITLSGSQGEDFAFNSQLCCNGGYALNSPNASQLSALILSAQTSSMGVPTLLK
jgi:Flp pilus assembly protein TadG